MLFLCSGFVDLVFGVPHSVPPLSVEYSKVLPGIQGDSGQSLSPLEVKAGDGFGSIPWIAWLDKTGQWEALVEII